LGLGREKRREGGKKGEIAPQKIKYKKCSLVSNSLEASFGMREDMILKQTRVGSASRAV